MPPRPPHNMRKIPRGASNRLIGCITAPRPEQVFVFFGLLFGLLLLVCVPPFQAPDEQHHFMRAYQLSEGILLGGHPRGEYLPRSLGYLYQVTSRDLPRNPAQKVRPGHIWEALGINLNPDDRTFLVVNAATYNPLGYLPQAVALALGRLLGLPPLLFYYLGRIITLAFFIGLVHWSIKKTPVLKWVFCLLGTMPMSVFLAASFSPDPVLASTTFLFSATIFDLAFSHDKKLSLKTILLPAILCTAVSSSKFSAYAPLAALSFLIPASKSRTPALHVKYIAIIVLPALIASTVWMALIWHNFLSIMEESCGDFAGGTLTSSFWDICTDPGGYVQLLVGTTLHCSRSYLYQFIGRLGWLDTSLPREVSMVYVAALLGAAILYRTEVRIHLWQRILAGCITLLVYVSAQTALYLVHTARDLSYIAGFQGRYLIPLGPAFFLILCNRRVKQRLSSWVPAVVITCLVLSIPATLTTVVQRYYGPDQGIWHMRFFDLIPGANPELKVRLSDERGIRQTFSSSLDHLRGVSIFMITFGEPRDTITTPYRFILKRDNSREIVREVELDAKKFSDGAFVDILFDPIADSGGKKYEFTLMPTSDHIEKPVGIVLSEKGVYEDGDTFIGGRRIDRDVVFKLIYGPPTRAGDPHAPAVQH